MLEVLSGDAGHSAVDHSEELRREREREKEEIATKKRRSG